MKPVFGFGPKWVSLCQLAVLFATAMFATSSFAKKDDHFNPAQTAVETFLVEGLKVEDSSQFLLSLQLKNKLEQGFKFGDTKAFTSTGELTADGEAALLSLFSTQSAEALEKVISNLGRREYPNTLLIGPAGSGKSFLIRQLVAILGFGVFPKYLEKPLGITDAPSPFLTNVRNEYFRKTQIVAIDYDLLSRDNTRSGQAFAKADVRMRSILSDLVNAAKQDFRTKGIRTVFVLEEVAQLPELVQPTLKKLLDETGFKYGTKNSLEKGSEAGFSVIGITTPIEYRAMIGGDSAVQRRYKVVHLAEPSEQQALAIMQAKRDDWYNTHGLILNDATLSYIISMRPFFNNPPLAMPDSVLSLANDLLAWYSDSDRRKHGNEITTEEAYEFLVNHAKLPVETWVPKDGQAPLHDLAERVKKHVIGHDAEIEQIAMALKRGRATGFRDVPVFIIMGPSGAGKDTLLKAFNLEMFGYDGSNINMSFAGLNGYGLRGILEGGTTPEGEAPSLLTNLEKGPSTNGIIGFNEVKDLPSSEFARLKTVLEEGGLRPHGKDLRERPFGINAIFLMGQYGEELVEGKSEKEIEKIAATMTEEKMTKILERGSADGKTGAIPYAVIQRAIATGGIVFLRPVSTDRYKDILEIKLEKIKRNLKVRSEIDLEVDDSILIQATRIAKNLRKDTRALDAIIKALTETAISQAFDAKLPRRQVHLRLSYEAANDSVIVENREGDMVRGSYPIPVTKLLRSRCETALLP